MNRRNFFALTLGVATTALLAGCGGGGGNGGGVSLTNRAVPVALPEGFSLPATDFVVGTVWKSAPLTAESSFLAKVPVDDQPGLALLRHAPTNQVVLIGFTNEGTRGVTPLGTAAALLYFAFGVSALPPIGQNQALALLEAHPATASLADVIARRVAASPFALTSEDAEIGTAVLAARSAILGGASRAVKMPTRQTRAELAPLLTVSPGVQSGANVEQGDDGQSIRFVNTKRRPLTVRTYRVAEDTGAGKVDLPKPVEVGSPVDVPAVRSISSAIVDLATLHNPATNPFWAPVTSVPVPLALTSGSTRTYFQTVALMASGKTDAEGDPTFFADGRFAGEVEKWRLDRGVLNSHAWVGGILGDIVGTIVGVAAVALTTAAINSLLARFEAVEAAAGTQFLKNVAQGYYMDGTITALKIAERNTFVGETFRGDLYELVGRGETAVAEAGAKAESAAMFEGACAVLLRSLALAGLVALMVDIGSTYVDILSSSKGEIWDSTIFKPTLQLSPLTQSIAAGSRVSFVATVPGIAPGQKVVYAWSKSGGANAFLSGKEPGKVGDAIETAEGAVDLVTSPSTQGVTKVTVIAYLDANGVRTEIGASFANVTIDTSRISVGSSVTTRSFRASEYWYAGAVGVVPIVQGAKVYEMKWTYKTDPTKNHMYYGNMNMIRSFLPWSGVDTQGPWTDGSNYYFSNVFSEIRTDAFNTTSGYEKAKAFVEGDVANWSLEVVVKL